MKEKFLKQSLIVFATCFACKSIDKNNSNLNFKIDPNPKHSGLVLHAFGKQIRVCYKENSSGIDIKSSVPRIIGKWLAPIREKYAPRPVAKVVESCNSPHLTIQYDPSSTRSYMFPNVDGTSLIKFGTKAVEENRVEENLLHEIGHTFGLDDTYGEGSFRCQPGQPDSVMCSWRNGSDLMEDDRNGVLAAFARIYPTYSSVPNCPEATFLTQSDKTYAKFKLPEMTSGSRVTIQSGAYNKYVFPKCNRVTWDTLNFACKGGQWVHESGGWNADGLCHGSYQPSIYLEVGDR